MTNPKTSKISHDALAVLTQEAVALAALRRAEVLGEEELEDVQGGASRSLRDRGVLEGYVSVESTLF